MNLLLNLAFILLFCSSGLMAQTEFTSAKPTKNEMKSNYLSGYIITSENDTLKGFIEKQSDKRNSKRCNFKQSLNSGITEYFPDDLKEYRFDEDKYYVSKTILLRRKEVNLFLELLVDGIADLYFFREDNITDHYFIQKADGKFFELTKTDKLVDIDGKSYSYNYKKYIGTLKIAFKDCPQIFPEIDQMSLDQKSLVDITKKYHECTGNTKKCIVYAKEIQEN